MKKGLAIIAGPLAGFMTFSFMTGHTEELVARMAFITIWMAIWWLTEAVETGVTALLPFVLMPLLNIMKAGEVAMQYMDQTIFLFIGGFFLAYAMEKWNLHNRIAYRILLITGNSPSRILAGIMLTSYIISMWISNTATTLMLVAAVIAIVRHKELFGAHAAGGAAACMTGLAYSATIGGMATLVGTPTNLIFAGYWQERYGVEAMSFLEWSAFAVPLSFILLLIAYYILWKMFLGKSTVALQDKDFFRRKYKELGPVSMEEKVVMSIFTITVVLWFSRSGLHAGPVQIPGWESLFPPNHIKDSTVAVAMALLLFVIPSVNSKGNFILKWSDVTKLPLHIILLFGGGFALAKGIEVSGMGDYLAGQLHFFRNYPVWMIIPALVLVITLFSELASNVATITLMLPILASLSEATGADPMLLMLPATFAASFGFMLHIATAPNTIVYASGYLSGKHLLKAGMWLNLAAIILLTAGMLLFR